MNMKNKSIENILFFSISFTIFIIAAYFLVFKLQFIYGDALSRTFHAYSVFFGNQPKLASIGFVWPPIPTLVQLPLVLISPLNTLGFAGNITSALFMSLAVVYLNKIFKYFEIGFLFRTLLLLMFILNPMILFFGANGMSEAIAICFIVASTYFLISYLNTKRITYILKLGASVSLAVMSRWEMGALIPVIILILATSVYLNPINKRFQKAEGIILLFSTPVIFTIVIWILANWVIMGNPFNFLTSIYSNTSQSGQLFQQEYVFKELLGNFGTVFLFVSKRIFFLYPAYLVIGTLIFIKAIKNKKTLLPISLLLLSLPILIFQLALLYKGQSFGWLRFFIYIIPFTYIFVGYLILDLKNNYRAIVLSCIIVLLSLSSISSLYAMSNPNLGREENQFINAILKGDTSYLRDRERGGANASTATGVNVPATNEIVNYINKNIKFKKILIDDFMGFPIIYLTQQPSLFVETIDSNFKLALSDPLKYKEIGYILAHKTGYSGDFDAINIRFPGIFNNGTNFTTLVKDFGDWRLYKIIE